MPNRNAYNTPAKPPVVEAQGHQKNPAAHTVDKAVVKPGTVQSMFGRDTAK
jgi:hypothetical protein